MKVKPGPELDALVASEVMGWSAWLDKRAPDKVIVTGHPTENTLYSVDKVWSPSTSIADAWEVVEKLGNNFHWHGYGEKHTCRFAFQIRRSLGTLPVDAGDYSHGRAGTLPLAICLAALRAVGVDVELVGGQ